MVTLTVALSRSSPYFQLLVADLAVSGSSGAKTKLFLPKPGAAALTPLLPDWNCFDRALPVGVAQLADVSIFLHRRRVRDRQSIAMLSNIFLTATRRAP